MINSSFIVEPFFYSQVFMNGTGLYAPSMALEAGKESLHIRCNILICPHFPEHNKGLAQYSI